MTAREANALWWAMQLARDVGACCSLLLGEPVDRSRLRPEWLELACAHELVQLNFAAVDLLHRRAELRELVKAAA